MSSFEPRLDILPESQRELWPELDVVPPDFVLYGGTALALQLGHRASEDFDFFSSSEFDSNRLQSQLPFFRDLDPTGGEDVWIHHKRDNLEGYVSRQGSSVKVAFFGGLDNLQRVEDPQRPVDSLVQVTSLVDLAGMKMSNSNAWQLERLRGHSRTDFAGCRHSHGFSGRAGNRLGVSTGDQRSGSAVLW